MTKIGDKLILAANTGKSSNLQSLKGFTLVELMVVIGILAIIAVVGFAVLTGTQSRARDAKRKADIQQMSKGMEARYTAGVGYTTSVDPTWFADGVVPTNPAPGGATYYTNSITTSSYAFCAALENGAGNAASSNGTGTTGSYFCQRNKQ